MPSFEPGTLSENDGKILLKLARSAIKNFPEEFEPNEKEMPEKLRESGASFVTITIGGRLRGCIGNLEPRMPLYLDVISNAVNSAFRDPRFPPLSKEEFRKIGIEVSVLGKQKESNSDSIAPGKDGVILELRCHYATFLPQVWEDLPDKGEFLSELSMKAGLPPLAWMDKNCKFSVYRVQKFEEH